MESRGSNSGREKEENDAKAIELLTKRAQEIRDSYARCGSEEEKIRLRSMYKRIDSQLGALKRRIEYETVVGDEDKAPLSTRLTKPRKISFIETPQTRPLLSPRTPEHVSGYPSIKDPTRNPEAPKETKMSEATQFGVVCFGIVLSVIFSLAVGFDPVMAIVLAVIGGAVAAGSIK